MGVPLNKVNVGDLTVLPSKKGSTVAVGRVVGAYEYRPDYVYRDASHTRRVQWLTQIPRSSFQDDPPPVDERVSDRL